MLSCAGDERSHLPWPTRSCRMSASGHVASSRRCCALTANSTASMEWWNARMNESGGRRGSQVGTLAWHGLPKRMQGQA